MKSKLHIGFVTYGDRRNLLKPTIEYYLNETEVTLILICNGVSANILMDFKKLADKEANRLIIITLNQNLGSAGGFSELIKVAKNINPELLLILDDDCIVEKKELNTLQQISADKKERQVFCCFRNGRKYMENIKAGLDFTSTIASKNSFMGFDLIRYTKRVLNLNKPINVNNNFIPYAPYGGLVMKQKAIQMCSLPRKEFFLYADDTEFTYNLSKQFGIELLPNIKVKESETSWNVSPNSSAASRIWDGRDDFRVFYSTRNQAYLDWNLFSTSKILVILNFILFSILVIAFGVIRIISMKINIRSFISRLKLYFKASFAGLRGSFNNEI